ncbi:hypothetical protein ACFOGG_02085 [Brenneria rubrifaciens]|uniref:hypothetical protein n=1 Tax=Brenneria rubrifaciens TaxID=55213 RepID=UPI00360D5B6F
MSLPPGTYTKTDILHRFGYIDPQTGEGVGNGNGDGRMSNGNELFGNHTMLSNGQKADNGFKALAEYDHNSDNIIEAQNLAYDTLQIETRMAIDGKTIHLNPGMNLTAEIKTGKRCLIEFITRPIQRSATESLRER